MPAYSTVMAEGQPTLQYSRQAGEWCPWCRIDWCSIPHPCAFGSTDKHTCKFGSTDKCTYERSYKFWSTYKFGSTYERMYDCSYVRFLAPGPYLTVQATPGLLARYGRPIFTSQDFQYLFLFSLSRLTLYGCLFKLPWLQMLWGWELGTLYICISSIPAQYYLVILSILLMSENCALWAPRIH